MWKEIVRDNWDWTHSKTNVTLYVCRGEYGAFHVRCCGTYLNDLFGEFFMRAEADIARKKREEYDKEVQTQMQTAEALLHITSSKRME